MLTDTKLRSLKPKPKIYRIADTNGLCIEVRPTGAKFWRYRYRYAGKATMAALGEYPLMGLADARAARDKARSLLKAGANPVYVAQAERAAMAERTGNTFGAIADELLAKRMREGLGAGSVKRERRLIEKDLAGIKNIPVAEVSAPALLAALRKLEARGTIETAHRARSFAGLVFKYAIATGRSKANPAADLTGALQQPQKQHFASVTDPVQVGNLLRAIHAYRATPVVMAALRLAPLVFVRPGELRTARWGDVDLDTAEWRFTASKTGMPHIVPLSVQAKAVLHELCPFTQRSEYVFPSLRSSKRPMSENAITVALRVMGFDGGTMTGHGFRAMARTILDEVLGFRPDFIEHQLAHAVRDPNGRAYNRTAHLAERKKMMQAWSDYLDGLRKAKSRSS
ncbi:integrase arm-type DNA-binding domain-containing protein [Lysobacter soli]|uniref:tyrosine-type recombinase/integrase n=1 Tax=Lysobacter soli TaxID=453783 RepID=UPI00209F3F4B|nr:integrase arm-type DNA-binding domain-containing protein [Lysobacter soli]UTA55176.1 integrase arm-type DNA-binding domain-containing protein [Lysobacter soli]